MLNILFCVLLFYAVLHLVDFRLKVFFNLIRHVLWWGQWWSFIPQASHSLRYERFVKTTNIRISWLNIRWSTSVCNGLINRLGVRFPRCLSAWFGTGTALTVVLIVPSLILLVSTALTSIRNFSRSENNEAVLQPVLPGVNLPSSDFVHYTITLAICTTFHELGHAVAAARWLTW